MAKPKAPKVIKCFSNSKDNKLKRQQELAMANAIRSYRHINARDDNDVLVQARQQQLYQQQQQQQQHQQQMRRGRSLQQRPEYVDYTNHGDYQFNQPKKQPQPQPPRNNNHNNNNSHIYRPNPPIAVVHKQPLPSRLQQQNNNSIHYLMDVQNALSGFGMGGGRSKSVPPELRQHFAGYNMYGHENEEEKIMEFSTDNSITSSRRSLTKKDVEPPLQQQQQQQQQQQYHHQEQKQAEESPPRLSEQQLKLFQQQTQQHTQQQQQQQERQRLSEQKLQLFQARIRDIQNNMHNPPVQQISIQHNDQLNQPAVPMSAPIKHHLPSSQQQQRSKTPEPIRNRLFPKINPRSKTPEPQRSTTPTPTPVPTNMIRTQRYHAEKIVTTDGNIMLKKTIVHVNRTRSCVACGFREWSEDDVAFLLVRRQNKDKTAPTADGAAGTGGQQPQQQQQVKWLCPDCACDNGLPKEHYHWNKNRLAPVSDPVEDITMNRPLGVIDPEDLEWVQRAQRKPKPMNWKSQYSEYYKNIRQQQRAKQAKNSMCCGPPPAPEDFSDDPEDDIRRVCANACYAPNYDSSEVGETCYSYVGDL